MDSNGAASAASPTPSPPPSSAPPSEEHEKLSNGANGALLAAVDDANGAVDGADKAPPLKPKSKPKLRAPPRRLRSGSGSGSNTSSGGVRRESGDPRPASANMGIVVGTLRRRNRRGNASAKTQQETAKSTASEEAEVDKKPGLERSNSSFAGVAQQVVTSRRAARGFLSMWTKDSTETMHVYRGIHMEKKKLDLVSVASEYKEIKRRQFYQELVVYFVFLLLLFSLLSWLPVQDSFHQNDVVGALTCREEGECEIKTFSDMYEFATKLRETVCDREDVTAQWVRVGGVGFRQFFGEATEMSTMGVTTYLGSDMWNLFELTHLVVLAALLSYMVNYYIASSTFALHLAELREGRGVEELSHISSQDLLTGFQKLSDLASLGSAISLLKVFKFLRMNATLNLLWRVLGMAMSDLMGFLVIFNLIFLGYSAMGSYAFGFALDEYSTISKSYGTCFQMLAGEMDYARLRQANPRVAPLFIGTFVVLVFQILVNMFVAILSEYYEVAKNDETASGDDVEYDVLARIRSFVSACSPTVVVPKDHGVIRLIPWQQVRLISTNLVDQEETRQRVRKLFRGAVWRVVALLRFGMKFDRRINFGDRKTHDGGSAHSGNGGSSSNGKDDRELVSHIRLSENFDHKTIKEMIPIGITIRLKGDSILGDGLALKVVHHGKLSVECIVLGPNEAEAAIGVNFPEKINGTPNAFAPPRTISSLGSFEDDSDLDDGTPRERVLELMGGEKLRIPRRRLAVHLCRVMLQELKMSLLRATKLLNYSKDHMVDDYHLGLLFNSVRADGRTSLRFDEISRMLDLYLRKDKRRAMCSQAEVRREALQVMYRFRKCLIDMPSREKEGHNYRPKPVDTSKVELGHLEHLGDVLARNCHDMWALERLKQGWQYGIERDDKKKKHPNLVPYKLLSVEEQAFDYRSSIETIKTIVFMNYTISRANHHDTSKVELGHLEHLGDVLARNCHDMWALERLKQGWQYGIERDDKKKKHPNLVPYKLLSVEEQAFDYRSSIETIKTIVFMNYTISRANHQRSHSGSFHDSVSRSASMMSDIADGMGGSNSSLLSGGSDSTSPRATDAAVFEELGTATQPGSLAKPVPSLLREAMSFRRNSLMGDSPYFTTYGEGNVEVYRPLPIDTTTVELPPRLLRLVDLLAENAHEVWAKGRMDEGWTYGPQRDDSSKKHPCLVPYVFLTDDEKEYDINIAKETLKTLIAMKFTILDRSSKY
ncbi:Ryanodine-inositol 1,4,5-triphosphate receptor Ca2 channel (RIR-CaC) family protein [Phytophthora palmivora]|uniref:Ryanodine-inositol 1,4,5-triphosphate receptor Ca2 channel (RIR-CaC) family protein n=1 Tax=Phytophthora palmivora TaxID=4796 RepID=A0A2P4WYY6_9STRA|nr:Ryanodine-inositol 1,4,5-triphosphate receptor Ca2 channel (RIR-CaC) family protein [Phytophthora palmivora]